MENFKNTIHIECGLKTMGRMSDEMVDLTITSPPYDNLRSYSGNYKFPFEDICKELFRVTKQGGIVVWVVNDQTIKGSESLSSFKQAIYFNEVGFNLHDTMIYNKLNPPPNAGTRYQQAFEYMFVFSKGKPKTTNIFLRERRNACNDKRTYRKKKFTRNSDGIFNESDYYVKEMVPRENVWSYLVGGGNSTKDKIAFKHPAIFPELMVKDHIESWSNKGDIVYDCFSGSGTTLKMAKILDRYYIGSEINSEYLPIIEERLNF